MKEWFKFIGLSFFSDNIAKRAPKYGLGSLILSAVLGIVFLLFGMIAAYALPFDINYKNTPELVATVGRAFSTDGAAIEVKDGVLYADRIIDTVKNDGDRENYNRGYDIVVDTRAADAFDDFTAYCVTASGKRISYEEYLELDADTKTLYTFKIEYGGEERVIDEAWVEKCKSYLDGVKDPQAAAEYEKVKKLSGDEYKKALYELYVKTYYPSTAGYESNGGAPKLRNYYFHNYGNREKIVFVFNDSMVGLLVTKTGAVNTFYGYYGKIKDGKVGTSQREINDFISDSYGGATSIIVYNAVVGFFTSVPFIVLVVLAVTFALFCLTKLTKTGELKFGAAAKIVCSFVIVSALITAITMFGFGCLVSQSLLAWLNGVMFFAILLVRTAIMLIKDGVKHRREVKRALETSENDGAKTPPAQDKASEATAEQIAAGETADAETVTEDNGL